jgi:hypothetical protein
LWSTLKSLFVPRWPENHNERRLAQAFSSFLKVHLLEKKLEVAPTLLRFER